MQGMQSGFSIGRLWGIEVKLNISLILIAVLVTLTVATGVLPISAPGIQPPFYYAAGALTAVLFIASVLWHEMAHALVALRYGIPVVQIILFMFGGVAQIAREPERPGQEFWIAIAGPASSFVLAISFGLLSRLGSLAGGSAGYLAAVNLSLVLFNLLPGFPLDGGRVLRSILWKAQGSYKRATRQASRVGQAVAGLFVLAAFALILNGAGGNGLWLLLIAGFLYMAATTTYRSAKSAALPVDTLVRRVMRFNVPVIGPDLPLAMLAWKYMDRAPDQAFPVMENDQLIGLVSATEIDPIPRLEWGKVRVSERMLPRERLRTVAPDDNIASALEVMDAARLNHAPVMEAGHLVGMLNRRDIVYRT